MLIGELPVLPKVSILDGPIFESVLFCRFVSLSGQRRELIQSQRQVLTMFNRSQQRAISRYFAKAREIGLLKKVRHTQGVDPDVYVRGDFFSRGGQESSALVTLSNALWGSGGLLKTFPFQTSWGHGCIPPAVILSIATLRLLDENISKKALRRYLAPLVPESSFTNAMKYIKERKLALDEGGELKIAPDWEARFRMLLETNPKCNQRFEKGEKRRKAESEANRIRVSRGKLTDAELTKLLRRPCVVKGCKRKKHQQEHFPPKKFLEKHFDVVTNPQLVWSICRLHNGQMKGFIARMPSELIIPPNILYIKSDGDSRRLYSASANYWIQRFYKACAENDISAGVHAVSMVIGLIKALEGLPQTAQLSTCSQKRTPRVKGKRQYSPARSQLPFHSEQGITEA